ncbi:hypothetical protein [Methylobacterium sp.]|uniref:hypothetical protein n=1 Tax=Methylobacterium sp. TaxID=409 RepID=UPI003AFF8565
MPKDYVRGECFASEVHIGKRTFCDVTTSSNDNHSFAGGKIAAGIRCGADDVPLDDAPPAPPSRLIAGRSRCP